MSLLSDLQNLAESCGVSVEDVKGRGMYIEVLAKKEVPTIG